MSKYVMPRRVLAGVVVIVALVTSPFVEPHEPHRVGAPGRISRRGGRVSISGRMVGLNVAPAAAGR